MFRKILCPIDLGDFTRFQLAFAKSFSQSQKAALTVLHAVPIPVGIYDIPSAAAAQSNWVQIARKEVEEVCKPGMDIVVTSGLVVDEIVNASETRSIDLIIMPTHGYKEFKRILLGSTFQGVLAKTRIPVLVLPPYFLEHGDPEFRKPENIVCAIDLQNSSARLIGVSEKLAEFFGASFIVMHSIDLEKEILHYLVPESLQSISSRVREKILTRYPGSGRAGEVIVEEGPAYERITHCTEDHHGDLLVLGSPHASPFRLRTTLQRTISQLKIPALCVPVNGEGR